MMDEEHPKGRSRRPRRTAYEQALGLLARREYSRRELQQRLARSGHDRDEIEAALDRLDADRYQDDGRFGEMLVRNRIGQGYGPRRIRAELRTHGLAESEVNALLGAADADWRELAAGQLRRRYGGRSPVDYAERAKRAQFLLRRGFDASTVNHVTRAEVDDVGDDA